MEVIARDRYAPGYYGCEDGDDRSCRITVATMRHAKSQTSSYELALAPCRSLRSFCLQQIKLTVPCHIFSVTTLPTAASS